MSATHRFPLLRAFPLICFALVIVGVPASVQQASAQAASSITGTVTDSSRAAVPGARIQVQEVNTGARRETVTRTQGQYQVLSLPVGEYRVTAGKPGFAPELRTGIHLAVGQVATVNLRLRVGGIQQQVTVHADASLLSLTNGDISGLVGEQQVKQLPLNGRSYDELMTLDPGIVNYTSQKTGGIGVSNSTVGNNFAVSGNRPQQNLYLLNGVEFTGAAEVNMQPGGTSQELLGVEAVREFNVLRDSYGAQYGKRPGAQVLIVTQSGTNQAHGSVYEFLRNNALDAPNYFDKGSAPPFQRNQFGAALGGPLQRNKTFLFGNYEGFRQHLHQTGVDLVPDNNARNGYLPCKLVSPAPNPCPPSGLVDVGVADSVKLLLALWPAPSPGAPDFGGISEAFNSPLQTIRDDFGTARLDRVFSSRDSFTGVYTIDDSDDVTPTSSNLYSTDLESLREQVASLEETHVFSLAWINTARFGFSRAAYFFTGEPTPGTPAAGVPGFVESHPVGAVVVGGSAAANPSAQVSLAGSNVGSNLSVHRNLYSIEDQLTYTHARHSLSVGVWLQPLQSNEQLALTQYGQATFTGLQQFLGGTVGSFAYDPTPTELNWRSLLGAWYVQDVIRLTPHLTASLGFRDEFTTGWNEAHGRAATFVFQNGVIQTQPHVGDNTFTVNNAKFLPQPRIGLAWNPWGSRTVVRAGFGMYNDLQDALGYRMDQNAPFNPSYSIADLPVSDFPLTATAPANAKIAPAGVQPDLNTPTLISWSLRVEQELSQNTTLTVGYVGSHGYHEVVSLDDNEPTPVLCPAAPCPAAYPATFAAPLAGSAVPAGSYYNAPGTPLANPKLGPAWAWFSRGDSSYNALQVDLQHRMSNNLMMRGVYTWSKALDNGDSLNATASGNAPGLVSNPFDINADWGPATYDVRNAAVIDALYTLPFGHGQRFGGSLPGIANDFLGGWTAASIVTLQSGFPFTPQLSYNPSNNGDNKNPVRPFLNPDFHGKVIVGKPSEWFDPSAFLAPPPNSGFYGNVRRDSFNGPGLATWDFSMLKDTTLHENLKLQFRAELFNLLNRANFNTPNLVVFTPSGVSPTAGVITSTSTTSRQVQFGAKLLF
ncbi:MAG TPA: carboxypeptidase regulatory-like domain-containing protein [Acidobacteriaceae bacterium]|nr:carboxypeptidase regulatory-like domain-containing protein [Acidobacteriaceae bacterium]